MLHYPTEISLPSWQKEAKDITYQIIQAMEEANKIKRAQNGLSKLVCNGRRHKC